MKRKYILWPIVLVALAGAIYAYMEYNRTRGDIRHLTPAFVVKADVLINDFVSDEAGSNKKYAGVNLPIEVEGNVKDLEWDDQGNYFLLMGDPSSLSSVRCLMDSVSGSAIKSLKKGEPVTVRGFFTGFKADETGLLGSDVELNGCILTKKK